MRELEIVQGRAEAELEGHQQECGSLGSSQSRLCIVCRLLAPTLVLTVPCLTYARWQDNALAWERWVYTFAQARQLAAFALGFGCCCVIKQDPASRCLPGSSCKALNPNLNLVLQARQLAVLAPVLPTDEPRLKPSTYDMVLAALLLHPAGVCGCGWVG